MSKLPFDPKKRMFTFVGTLEPRKNVAAIMLAFESLWDAGIDASLTIIGRTDVHAPAEAAILERITGRPLFQHFGHATDDVVRKALASSRATIFVSSVEGFGIPPYESLFAGIPVIASKGIPSLDLLPPGGRLTIDDSRPKRLQTLSAKCSMISLPKQSGSKPTVLIFRLGEVLWKILLAGYKINRWFAGFSGCGNERTGDDYGQ